MRQSERKRYLHDLQEQDQSQDNPPPERKKYQKDVSSFQKDKKYYNKYETKSRKQYFDILEPTQLPYKSQRQRQDYNSKNPPKPKEKQPYRNNNYNNQHSQDHNNWNNPRQFDKSNQQLERYSRNTKDNRKIQNKSSVVVPNKKVIDIDENEDDQNLSFIVDNSFKKDKLQQKRKHEDSFHIKEKVQSKHVEQDDDDWLGQQKQVKTEKKVESQRSPIKQQKRLQIINQPAQINQRSQSNSLNRAFNNLTEQSINGSSVWVEEKLLQNLSLSQNEQINDSNISNNHSQSYVSSIRQQSQLYDINPSNEIEIENGVIRDEISQNKLDRILDEIQRSKEMLLIDAEVSITNVKNIMSAIIKEIQLVQLKMNVELTIRQEGIIVKNTEIQFEKLSQYINFHQINVVFPRIYSQKPVTQKFRFCNIRASFPEESEEIKNTSKFIKKEKKKVQPSLDWASLLKIVKIQLKCMSCQAVSCLPNNCLTNEASLSCRNCDEQMISKIIVSHSQ